MRGILNRWEAFWLGRTVEVGRLTALRVVFFGLLGLDLLTLMVEKAYRYGTGGFNVAHFDALDAALPLPNAAFHTVLYLLAGFLSLRVSMGIAMGVSLRLLTVTYAYTYFSSLHDGYQHHYLIAWILLIFWAIPLEKTGGVDHPGIHHPPTLPPASTHKAGGKRGKKGDGHTAAPPTPRIQSWGVSLLYAQVSIVYLFTALTKANLNWFNGWALKRQIGTPWVREMLDSLSASLPGEGGMYAVVATSVFLWQFLAAVSFVWPHLRSFACISGPIFHVMVEVIGLEIRWFSYYMIALYYLLLFPDSWYAWVTERGKALVAPLAGAWQKLARPVAMGGVQRWILTAVTAVVGFALAYSSPLPGRLYLGLLVAALIILGEVFTGPQGASRALPRLGAQLALALITAQAPAISGATYDYYRQQGGDLARRGETDAAIDAYFAAIAENPGPDSRHAKLGSLLMARGRVDEAIEVYERGLKTDPDDERLKKGLAQAQRRAR